MTSLNTKSETILLLAGDGIGPEVMAEAKKLLLLLQSKGVFKNGINIQNGMIGGASWQIYKTPLNDETLEKAKSAKAILLGAVGGPQFDNLARELRPEVGLLKIRKELDLFANLRPILCYSAISSASTLKEDVISNLDLMIVRELSSGVYFGEPRGIFNNKDGEYCIDTQYYTKNEIIRIAKVGFETARNRNKVLHSVDKANVMETGHYWRRIVSELHKAEYSDIQLVHMYADNCAMQLVRQPKQFDVIVTDNLFGDILSDCGAMLTGSLGMLPSASLGPEINGSRRAMYEPVHGSAPDISGKGIANPLAMFSSVAMMFRYSFQLYDIAKIIDDAIGQTLIDGARSADIAKAGDTSLSTKVISDKVILKVEELLGSYSVSAD